MLPLGRQAQRLAGAATRQGYRTRCVGSAAPATEAPCGAAPAEGAVPAELAAEAARGARGGRERQALPPVAPPSEEVLRRNAELVERLKGEVRAFCALNSSTQTDSDGHLYWYLGEWHQATSVAITTYPNTYTSPTRSPAHCWPQLILAPLTRGGHLPFRRLCADFGARATMGEMTFARLLLKGDRVERTRLKKAGNETLFGFQMATNVRAAQTPVGAML